jgi:hypothetical protein
MSTEVCISCIRCIRCVRCIAVLVRASKEELFGERFSFPKWSLDYALSGAFGKLAGVGLGRYIGGGRDKSGPTGSKD